MIRASRSRNDFQSRGIPDNAALIAHKQYELPHHPMYIYIHNEFLGRTPDIESSVAQTRITAQRKTTGQSSVPHRKRRMPMAALFRRHEAAIAKQIAGNNISVESAGESVALSVQFGWQCVRNG
jgi:hypothetical protein